MRSRTLVRLAGLAAVLSAVGCAFRSGGVAPEVSRYQPPAADGIPATLGPTTTTVPVAAAAPAPPV
ncbi:MAG: hypothetical protein K2X87_15925, partial [Gemmataceae bacterium]|nr:hypothetical protein [Gemmataceae bacterium]